ncbi:hypothetical protein CA54_57310 [Symmachiella macrocystis]|uniref:Uncharacterized protein n=1 Tax=Symmachiella macrocystis TaxID=2527985 RepID=A0A5C6B4U5_9PLAN|nr:hypothetical protein [Symmachiella macrocystis]TWU07325.1 hypothetical protein CA54_57310 [Symmachiella macrocystis]
MGAQLWYQFSSPQESPLDALHELQDQRVADYDLPSMIEETLKGARDAVEECRRDDPCEILELYESFLFDIEQVAAAEIPDDWQGRLEILNKLNAGSGEGLGNILDVLGVSDDEEFGYAYLYSDEELSQQFEIERPTIAEAKAAIEEINTELHRGESVCFRVFAEDRTSLAGWCFVGNSVD